MSLSRRPSSDSPRESVSGAGSRGVAAALGFCLLLGACHSAPIRAWQGARHYSAGTDALAQGDDDRAVGELERAAVLVPHASEIRNHLGLAYWANGDLSAARSAFEAALELDCENAAARSNLEQLLATTGSGSLGQEGNARHGG